MSRQKKADLLLILNTGFWGCSYYLSDLALEEMPPLALCAFRFLTAFCLLGVILFPKLRRPSRETLLWALPAGLALTLTYIGATVRLLYTSISNAGFICADTDFSGLSQKAGASDADCHGGVRAGSGTADAE